MTTGFTVFETTIGRCGMAWGDRGVVGVQLPEASVRATRARMLRRFPTAREATPPPGATRSYGDIAKSLGAPGSARAVGQALGCNPFAMVVPWHRVLAAGGRVGAFSADGGVTTKRRILSLEGAGVGTPPPSFDGADALGFDPQVAIAHLCARDPALGRVVRAVGPFDLQLKKASSVFLALAEAIVYQQLSGKAAETIFGRVRALFPRRGLTAEQILRTPDDRLRGAGLSRPKLLALRDLSRRAAAGEIPTLPAIRRMDDEAIVERLTHIRGIGRWTAQMLLIFWLGRPDVLPVDDYGIRKGFAIAFKKRTLPAPTDVEAHGERWKPYRTVASWYLWRAVRIEDARRAANPSRRRARQ